jgi:hypothetical protein
MEPKKPEPKLDDIGTRYEHLMEYRDSLETCMQILNDRGLHSLTDKQRMIKFAIALEVINTTLDAFAGMFAGNAEYIMYRLLNSVPKNPGDIMPTRGTPLR